MAEYNIFKIDGNCLKLDLGRYKGCVDLSTVTGNFVSSKLISYNTNVPFTSTYSYATATKLSANVTFTKNTTGAIAGAVTLYRVLGDGISTVSFTGIKKTSTSSNFNTADNILNILVFFFDGYNYWVNIFQEENAQPIDLTAPVLQSIVISDAFRNKAVLTYNETLSSGFPVVTANLVFSGGKTITASVWSGATLTVTFDSSYAYGDVVTATYNGTFIKDISENNAIPFTAYSVTNNIAAPDVIAPTLLSAIVSNAAPSNIVLTYNETINPAIIPATSTGAVSGKTITGVAISGSTVTYTVNTPFVFGDTITFSYTQGVNKIQDMSGNFAANLVSQAVTNNIASSSQIVVWENLVNASGSTNAGFITTNGTLPSGGRGTVAINTANNFEVFAQFTTLSPATVLFLDRDSTNAYVWGASQTFEAGAYQVGGNLYWAVNGTVPNNMGAVSIPIWVKLRKSGNNIILSTSATENGSYTDVKTFTDAIVGVSTLYIHVLFASNANGDRVQVKYTN